MKSEIQIKERAMGDFFEAPFYAYGDRTPYVSLFKDDVKRFLNEKKNPLFKHFGKMTYFTAYRNGTPLGRLTAHVHEASNQRYGWKRSYFGFFDCADDPELAAALLKKAEDWGRAQGCTEIMGNFNLTAMQQIGVMTGGFENAPYTDMVYSPEHISQHLEANGYTRSFPMTTFDLDVNTLDPETVISPKHRELMKDPQYQFGQVKKSQLKTQLEHVWQLLNAGFNDNPMFVPLTLEEFHFQAKDLMWIIDERISSIVYRNGEPLGALICIPDLNPLLKKVRSRLTLSMPFHFIQHQRNRKRAVIIFYSVRKDVHSLGIGTMMVYHVVKNLQKHGYEKVGGTWISDENKASLAPAHRMGFKPLHRLHLYRKDLS